MPLVRQLKFHSIRLIHTVQFPVPKAFERSWVFISRVFTVPLARHIVMDLSLIYVCGKSAPKRLKYVLVKRIICHNQKFTLRRHYYAPVLTPSFKFIRIWSGLSVCIKNIWRKDIWNKSKRQRSRLFLLKAHKWIFIVKQERLWRGYLKISKKIRRLSPTVVRYFSRSRKVNCKE